MHHDDGEGASESSESLVFVRDARPPPVNETGSLAQHIAQVKRMRTRLQVILVCVANQTAGVCIKTLALLDSGADCHLMAEELYTNLGLIGLSAVSETQLANGI